jgi:hypothetical protein
MISRPQQSRRLIQVLKKLVGGFCPLMVLGCSSDLPEALPQPIAFSHIAHSENDISCTRCHQGAETQAQAGLPPISSCASCHRRGVIPDHPEVLKFMEKLEEREPLIWGKVNVLPTSAMVHFKHKPHARAGIDCSACHGDVSQMALAQPVINTANMGWCVSCHRENEASVDCLTCHH